VSPTPTSSESFQNVLPFNPHKQNLQYAERWERGEIDRKGEEGFRALVKKMPATWRQGVLVPGKLGAFPSPDAAAPRVRDREEGVRGRGVVLAVGVGEEKPRAGTTVDLVMSPDACRRRLDGLRCVTPHQQAIATAQL